MTDAEKTAKTLIEVKILVHEGITFRWLVETRIRFAHTLGIKNKPSTFAGRKLTIICKL